MSVLAEAGVIDGKAVVGNRTVTADVCIIGSGASGAPVAAELAAAGTNTKQLQISLQASRTNQTVVAATNTVLSARFILRNKIVTA